MRRRYGWKASLPDHRDLIYNNRNLVAAGHEVPPKWDLTAQMPPIYDQGQLGSCTGNGWARVMEYREIVQGEGAATPSRLFIYYNERLLEGDPVDQDTGAQVRTGAKVVATVGAPPETDWPYIITRFAERPPESAYADAKKHEALEYQRIIVGPPGAPMRTAISSGLPIVFGFSVPDYFEAGWDFSTPLPVPGPTTSIIGGHCVVICGYDFTCTRFATPAFLCANSWGANWGLNGYFWMEHHWFNPVPGLATDLWVVKQTT